jgi:hypothetical protein
LPRFTNLLHFGHDPTRPFDFRFTETFSALPHFGHLSLDMIAPGDVFADPLDQPFDAESTPPVQLQDRERGKAKNTPKIGVVFLSEPLEGQQLAQFES